MIDTPQTARSSTAVPHLDGHTRARRSISSVLRDVWRRQQVSAEQRALLRPRHLLLVGPIGSGKTTLLRDLLADSQQPFVRISAAGWLRNGDDLPGAETLVQAVVDAARKQRAPADDAPLGAAVLWIDDIQALVVNDDDANASSARTLQREIARLVDDAAGAPSVGEVDTGELLVVLSGATMQGKPPDLLPDLGARMVAQIMLEPLGDADLVTLLRQPTLPFCARYAALATADGVTLTFEDEALEELAAIANELNSRHDDMGAHRLVGLLDRVVDGHLPVAADDDAIADDADESQTIADAEDASDGEGDDDAAVDESETDASVVTITAAMVEERLADLLEDDDLDGAIL